MNPIPQTVSIKRYLTSLVISCLCLSCFAQGFHVDFFYGHLPSARSEALGRADVAVGGTAFSTRINPAGIGGIQTEFAASTSAPFYVLSNSNYYTASFVHSPIEKLTVGATFNQFRTGETFFTIDIGGVDYDFDVGNSTNTSVTLCYELFDNLFLGSNINLFQWKLFSEVTPERALYFDFGLLYKLKLNQSNDIQFGANIDNAFKQTYTFTSPDNFSNTGTIPNPIRVGAAYIFHDSISYPVIGKGKLELLFTSEYQNLLVEDLRNGMHFGFETEFLDILAIRLGYFYQNLDDGGFATNNSVLRNFTYGFGFHVPFASLIENCPLDMQFDYASFQMGKYATNGITVPNMRNFSVRLFVPINQN
ncbi:hypothetical protein GYB22_10120 [bacterium]|nr:hypothetical protein [bacterium]